jgi:AhpD family alkylhydroperoxidase
MTARMNIEEIAPEAYKTLLGLERYARNHVEPALYQLVKLRASIVNGCAFCVDMHSRDALTAGERLERLFGLAAWHDTDFYTPRERAALALTDAVTQLGSEGVPDDVWNAAAEELAPRALADLLVGIATINMWNRIAIPTRIQRGQRRVAASTARPYSASTVR